MQSLVKNKFNIYNIFCQNIQFVIVKSTLAYLFILLYYLMILIESEINI